MLVGGGGKEPGREDPLCPGRNREERLPDLALEEDKNSWEEQDNPGWEPSEPGGLRPVPSPKNRLKGRRGKSLPLGCLPSRGLTFEANVENTKGPGCGLLLGTPALCSRGK